MRRLKNPKIIWDGTADLQPFIDDYREDYPDLTDDELYELAQETLCNYLDDERDNLNIETRRIVVFADLGSWDGRSNGLKFLGENLSTVLQSLCDGNCTFFSDGVDVCGTERHYDGTNHYVYRELKPQFFDIDLDLAFSKSKGAFTQRQIAYYTSSLVPYVNKVYGW